MILYQKDQDKKLRKIDTESLISTVLYDLEQQQQQYIEQQAYRVYIASIYQPEAVYDLLVAA
jgi:hypothetical protein